MNLNVNIQGLLIKMSMPVSHVLLNRSLILRHFGNQRKIYLGFDCIITFKSFQDKNERKAKDFFFFLQLNFSSK